MSTSDGLKRKYGGRIGGARWGIHPLIKGHFRRFWAFWGVGNTLSHLANHFLLEKSDRSKTFPIITNTRLLHWIDFKKLLKRPNTKDMNKIKERRKVGSICPHCKSPDYVYLGRASDLVDGKHEFKCNSCHGTWQYGRTESKFTKLA